MRKTKKILAIVLSCLTVISSISFAACESSEPHTHHYVETVVPSTCTIKGYTEHKCACGDSYKDNEQELLSHSGRYQCSVCQMDFCEKLKEIIDEEGSFWYFDSAKTISISTTEAMDIFAIATITGRDFIGILGYDSSEKEWIWSIESEVGDAAGRFETLSSTSTTVPCNYSTLGIDGATLVKSMISAIVYVANQKLELYDAGFTMENLGLKF